MNTQNIYIVGEKFTEFTRHKNVMTLNSLKQHISRIDKRGRKIKKQFIIGQGVRHDQFNFIRSIIKEKELNNLKFINEFLMDTREEKEIVHKYFLENVLITKPKILDKKNRRYEAALILDERCAEMSDHITGQHLQGMLLTEAARQMMTAVTERYILSENERNNFYFTLKRIFPVFKFFTFPLEVSITYDQLNLSVIPSKCIKSTALISFVQKERLLCEVEIEISAFNKDILKKIEEIEAIKLLNQPIIKE